MKNIINIPQLPEFPIPEERPEFDQRPPILLNEAQFPLELHAEYLELEKTLDANNRLSSTNIVLKFYIVKI